MRLDAAGQDGGRAFRTDGNNDRVAVHEGRCRKVGDSRLVRGAHQHVAGSHPLGDLRVQAFVTRRGIDKGHLRRQGKGQRVSLYPLDAHQITDSGFEVGRDSQNLRLGLQQQTELGRGFFATAKDDDRAVGDSNEKREGFHRAHLRESQVKCADFLPFLNMAEKISLKLQRARIYQHSVPIRALLSEKFPF